MKNGARGLRFFCFCSAVFSWGVRVRILIRLGCAPVLRFFIIGFLVIGAVFIILFVGFHHGGFIQRIGFITRFPTNEVDQTRYR